MSNKQYFIDKCKLLFILRLSSQELLIIIKKEHILFSYRKGITMSNRLLLIALAGIIVFNSLSYASPPSPELLEELKGTARLEEIKARLSDARAKGVFSPGEKLNFKNKDSDRSFSSGVAVQDTFRLLVILADFSDNPASGGLVFGQPADFENLLFAQSEFDNFPDFWKSDYLSIKELNWMFLGYHTINTIIVTKKFKRKMKAIKNSCENLIEILKK